MKILLRKLRISIRNPAAVPRRIVYAASAYSSSALRAMGRSSVIDRFLSRWRPGRRRSWLNGAIYDGVFDAWIRDIYLVELDPDRRERLKNAVMGGSNGVDWAQAYEARPIDRTARVGMLAWDEAIPLFPAMDALLARLGHQGAAVVQIGSSSGRETAYFAGRAPSIAFIGLDIDRAIAERAAAIHGDANIRFVVGHAHTLLDDCAVPAEVPLVVFSSGSLQYVQPEHLRLLMSRLAVRPNTHILIMEPVDPSAGRVGGSRYRGCWSYSHDYAHYCEAAGLTTVTTADFQVDEDPLAAHHSFYHGRSPGTAG